MNMKQVWGALGGFFVAYVAITLTNKPAVVPKSAGATEGNNPAVVTEGGHTVSGGQDAGQQAAPPYQKGMMFPAIGADALGKAASDDALTAIAATGAQWVALTPVLYQDTGSAIRVAADPAQTPSLESLTHAIAKCRELGLKVMIKPLVVSRDGTRRENFSPVDPAAWAESYQEALTPYLTAAGSAGVEVFCLGSAYSRTESTVPWPALIRQAREHYKGALTYGASHRSLGNGGFKTVPFWSELDYIGIEAFFPLSTHAVPSERDLQEGWQLAADDIEAWLGTLPVRKPVLFTGIGYASLVGGATEPDRLPPGAQDDPGLQARAYGAFFSQVYKRPWLAGSYWFGWTNPALEGPAGEANPYAIEGKPAFDIVKAHYGEAR